MATDGRYTAGVARISDRLSRIKTVLSVAVLQEEIGNLLLRRTLTRFDREVDPDERPWTPLQSSTLERRKRQGVKGKKILVQTGALRGSIRRIRGSASGVVAVNTGAGFRIGVDDPEQFAKASAHQRGTGSVPVRRFLGVGRLDVRSVDSFLRRRSIDAMR